MRASANGAYQRCACGSVLRRRTCLGHACDVEDESDGIEVVRLARAIEARDGVEYQSLLIWGDASFILNRLCQRIRPQA